MGMSTHIVGLRGNVEDAEKVRELCSKNVWDAPKIIEGIGEVSIGSCVKEYSTEDHEGYEIEVAKIPKGVEVIRFYNSW